MAEMQPRTPRWVFVLGALIVIVVLTVAIVHILGGGMAGMH